MFFPYRESFSAARRLLGIGHTDILTLVINYPSSLSFYCSLACIMTSIYFNNYIFVLKVFAATGGDVLLLQESESFIFAALLILL